MAVRVSPEHRPVNVCSPRYFESYATLGARATSRREARDPR